MKRRDPRLAVVLLSGGLDSAVTAAIARSRGFRIHALTVGYGQRHAVELDAARRVAAGLGVASHRVVEVDLRAIGGSALTDDGIEVPKAEGGAPGAGIPPTYVPARNTVLLGLALGHAEVLGARDIFLGISSVDSSGYPDCRPEFLAAFRRLAAKATKAGVQGARFRIHAPLLQLTKADTVRRGIELGVDLGRTHSCYHPAPDGAACGGCDSCRLRREAFRAAGVPDPTRYAPAPPLPGPAPSTSGPWSSFRPAGEPRRPEPAGRGPSAPAPVSPTLRVLEIHRTIQGETTFAGAPCAIVRLAGCPLRCSYCDTAWAREAEGTEMSVLEVAAAVAELGPNLVAVTGGEPLAQDGTPALLRTLADDGRTVLVETSGALDISAVDPRVRRIVDVKAPGSGMVERNLPGNLGLLRPGDELKLVLCDRADYEWARDLVRRERLDIRCPVLFSPARGRLDPAELAGWLLEDGLPVRLQLQLHRILWPEDDRGR